MKCFFVYFFTLYSLPFFGQLTNKQIRYLKRHVKNDTSYVYWLPYKKDKSYLLVQGVNSHFSHKGELSFDFKMKTGTEIYAARDGVVIETKSDGNKGGNHVKYRPYGNRIKIQHIDGSIAMYWHLKQNGVSVNVGEYVKKGQLIGYSGNTGISAFPHLHFQLIDKTGKEIFPRFHTKKGDIYLSSGRWYRCVYNEINE